ncbi:hypothetical protein Esti_000193 [Eimeria stiedai]
MEAQAKIAQLNTENGGQIAGKDAGVVQSVCTCAADEARATLNRLRGFGSFFSPLSGYFNACREARSLSDWMRANKRAFGSELLYTDELATGFLFGYATGAIVKSALKFGLVLVGAGYLAVLAMSHYGWLSVNWHKVGESVVAPLTNATTATVGGENSRALRFKIRGLLQRSIPATAGFAVGLYYNLTRG